MNYPPHFHVSNKNFEKQKFFLRGPKKLDGGVNKHLFGDRSHIDFARRPLRVLVLLFPKVLPFSIRAFDFRRFQRKPISHPRTESAPRFLTFRSSEQFCILCRSVCIVYGPVLAKFFLSPLSIRV